MEKNEDVSLLKMDMKEAGEMTWKKELRMNLSMKAKASMLSWERCCSGEAASESEGAQTTAAGHYHHHRARPGNHSCFTNWLTKVTSEALQHTPSSQDCDDERFPQGAALRKGSTGTFAQPGALQPGASGTPLWCQAFREHWASVALSPRWPPLHKWELAVNGTWGLEGSVCKHGTTCLHAPTVVGLAWDSFIDTCKIQV